MYTQSCINCLFSSCSLNKSEKEFHKFTQLFKIGQCFSLSVLLLARFISKVCEIVFVSTLLCILPFCVLFNSDDKWGCLGLASGG